MKRVRDGFVFPPELGKRLKAVRRRAGLTQFGLARAMGRPGQGTRAFLSHLEHGDIRYPSLGVIVDYLRACGASFKDLGDILDKFTGQPAVVEQAHGRALVKMTEQLPAKVARQVVRAEASLARADKKQGKPPPDPAKRLARARRNAAAAFRRQVLEKVLNREVNNAGVKPTMTAVSYLKTHAHKVFRILYRTRRSKPVRREELLQAAEAWMVSMKVLPLSAIQYIAGIAQAVFERLERSGDLDWLPDWTVDDLDTVLLTPQRRRELKEEQRDQFRQSLAEYTKAREALVEQVWQEVLSLLEQVPKARHNLYRAVARELCGIVDRFAPSDPRAQQQAGACISRADYVRLGLDRAIARRVAELVLPRYDELRNSLPAHPSGWFRPRRDGQN